MYVGLGGGEGEEAKLLHYGLLASRPNQSLGVPISDSLVEHRGRAPHDLLERGGSSTPVFWKPPFVGKYYIFFSVQSSKMSSLVRSSFFSVSNRCYLFR